MRGTTGATLARALFTHFLRGALPPLITFRNTHLYNHQTKQLLYNRPPILKNLQRSS